MTDTTDDAVTLESLREWLEREEARLLESRRDADTQHQTFLDGCLNIIRTLRGSLHTGRFPE